MSAVKCLAVFVISYLFFFALSPGVIVTFPKGDGCEPWMQIEKKNNKNCATSIKAVAVHAGIFSFIMMLICAGACQMGFM